LPISRSALLGSGLAFCIICAYAPVMLGIVVYGLLAGVAGGLLAAYLLGTLLAVASLIVFNVCIFLVANNMIDGAIMVAAYMALPLALLMVINLFLESYVAGLGDYNFGLIAFLSPIYMAVSLFISIGHKEALNASYLIALAVILVIFGFILYRTFVNRRVERAGTPSTERMAYPFIIYIYLIMTLLCISAGNGYIYPDLFHFLKENFILYVILFAVFVTAYFIYKRKFYFSVKIVGCFLAAAILSIVFAGVCKSTQGFGLSHTYPKNDVDAYYQLNCWYDEGNRETIRAINELIDKDTMYCSVYIVGNNNSHERPISKNSVRIFEELREQGIDDFYSYGPRDNYANLNINGLPGKYSSSYYHYDLSKPVSLDMIRELARDTNIHVIFSTEYGDYRMDEKGGLTLTENWPDLVY
ncbi:MAG: hypothetical protein IKF68_02895, partial [Erysipelotrichaceae bacterium]|nr:hypothetical protein [Erysipelotrichaceae bacterium]